MARAGSAWLELTKPRLSLLVVATSAAGYAMGAGTTGAWQGLPALVAGTAAVAGGANVFNHIEELRWDACMERTRRRPLPAGRVAPARAALFGLALASAGILLLAAGTNLLTTALGLVTLLIYVGVYTPLKRHTSLCTLAGAVVGGLPPVMGWTAATGAWQPGAWALFGLLFVWQIPHFLAIAWMYRDDYRQGGFHMLPCCDPAGQITANVVVLYLLALVPVSLAIGVTGLAGWLYLTGTLAAGGAFLTFGLRFHRRRNREAARALFLASLAYLPVVMILMLIDRFVFLS